MKKTMKILTVLLMVVMIVATLSNVAFAADLDWDSITISGSDTSGASQSVSRMAGAIINIVQIVGMAVAVIMLIVLAIKYISAAPSDKAEIKKHAVVYVVGAIVLFAASGILEIIQNFSKNIG